MGRSLFANNARWLLLLLVMLGLLAQTSSSQEGRKLGTCGPPPRKNPQRQTSAESMPPLPLPATPLRRTRGVQRLVPSRGTGDVSRPAVRLAGGRSPDLSSVSRVLERAFPQLRRRRAEGRSGAAATLRHEHRLPSGCDLHAVGHELR